MDHLKDNHVTKILFSHRKERDRVKAICLSGHLVAHLPCRRFAFRFLRSPISADITKSFGARDFSPASRDCAAINVAWNEY